MKLLTILQALALLALAVIGATAGGNEAGDCPTSDAQVQCDL